MTITNTSSPDSFTGFPEVRKKWSGVDVTNFSGYYEALQARLIDYIWNDASLKQEILTNPKVVFERETGITFPADVEVKVLDEQADNIFYFVIPVTPPEEEQWYRYEQFSGWWTLTHTWWYMYSHICGFEKARPYRECLQALWIVRTWKDEAFKKQVLTNPRGVFEGEMGITFPKNLQIQSLEETSNLIYFVLPKNPQLDNLDENAIMGEWWRASHAWWWWLTSLRFRQPAMNTVTGIVG